ncbi:hypothetical protein PAXRUDRAFT_38141, partial [Paxillus rubicundulus Ve08.2h10]
GTIGFLEDENGQIVDKEEQQHICNHQCSLCYTLLTYDLAPTSWGKCPDIAHKFLVRLMRIKFPVLRYCMDDWKADMLMGLYYLQW